MTESASEGTDTINSSVSFTASSNVENLTLTGSSAINATGNTLANYLTGNSGANSLTGGDGNDTLDGGAGSDTLAGDGGNDVYWFGLSDGTDSLSDSGGTDTIFFESGISESTLALFKASGSSTVQVGYTGTSDQVSLTSQTGSGVVEQYELSNGKYLTNSEVDTVLQAMATYATNNSIAFTSLSDVKNSSELMNIVSTAWHT